MRIQVKKGGTVNLPEQVMRVLGIRENDFLDGCLTGTGILFTPIAQADDGRSEKKLEHG